MNNNKEKDLTAGDRIAYNEQVWKIVEEYYNPENLVHYFKCINETTGNGQILEGTKIYSLDYTRLVGTKEEEEEKARLVRLEEKHKRGERNRELQQVRFKINIM